MQRLRVRQALESEAPKENIVVKGWVRTKRENKGFAFIELNDGTSLSNLQVIIDEGAQGWDELERATTGASVSISGNLIESPGKGQKWEVKASELRVIGEADPESFPLQKKRHSDEFLRSIAHLRPRTNKYGSIFRIRSEAAYAVHKFFHDNGFRYVHSPILTGSDCEGAGEMFRVTTLDPYDGKKATPEDDFFGKNTSLTVSGQLAAEIFATSLGDVYTFGPTFRAENSNTPRHAAEFWMIEPEMAFADLKDDMDLGEKFLKSVVSHLREHCAEDMELFSKWVDKSLTATLDTVVEKEFQRVPYTEAVEILKKNAKTKKGKDRFEYAVEWGIDLQTEHERFLTEDYFKCPVIVYDYPKDIKAFYMRMNEDNKTVAAMDILVPRVGEIIGGSQREERMDVLTRRIQELGLPEEEYWWYMDLRRFGSVPHSGFGMGFERLLMMVTGVANIRDVIPCPRTPKHLEF
ncbi:asparagine--tRNA ligase [Desulfobaculum bizertense]|uniref:Asparagine--tRNA ligase n=1 Tax=Desulfobaculum bizertense DSM 18034 TaxID=1121442 RepID=A0A1T4X5V7_9BACT|nr:asparagine--tRNA ligase [Desulfobaculum bizertense]UIJ37550.1 asparagine--tRNA ligase [Desulfobaculum bizertense]SKA84498.1 asparaginyl-tRNA synthetase [Desulfobaculum bizertense DSM 18034]